MPEPLVLKIVTDADDSGIKRVNSGIEDLQISSHKATHATREFLKELSSVSDTSDLASVALGSFSRVLGGSLAGTALVIAAKSVIDTFREVGAEVDKSKESFDALKEQLSKEGLPQSFAEGSAQASRLTDEISKLDKQIRELNSGEQELLKGDLKGYFKGLVSTITGAGNELANLRQQMANLAKEREVAGAKAELKVAKETQGLSPQEIEEYKLRAKFEADVDKASVEAGLILREKYEIDKSNIADKYAKQELEKVQARAKESAAQELKEYEAAAKGKMDAQKILADSEAKQADSRAKALKDELEQQSKLAQLYQDRSGIMEKLTAAQDALTKKQGEMAQQAAGLGGTSRGPGQRPTSYELGAAGKVKQATTTAELQQAEQTRQQIQDEIIKQRTGQAPTGLTKAEKNAIVSPEAVQIALTEQRIKEAQVKATENGSAAVEKLTNNVKTQKDLLDKNSNSIKNNTKSLDHGTASFEKRNYDLESSAQDLTATFLGAGRTTTNMVDSFLGATDSTDGFTTQTDEASDAVSNFTSAVRAASGALYAEGGGKGAESSKLEQRLIDIYMLLEMTLDELKTYAHAT